MDLTMSHPWNFLLTSNLKFEKCVVLQDNFWIFRKLIEQGHNYVS